MGFMDMPWGIIVFIFLVGWFALWIWIYSLKGKLDSKNNSIRSLRASLIYTEGKRDRAQSRCDSAVREVKRLKHELDRLISQQAPKLSPFTVTGGRPTREPFSVVVMDFDLPTIRHSYQFPPYRGVSDDILKAIAWHMAKDVTQHTESAIFDILKKYRP